MHVTLIRGGPRLRCFSTEQSVRDWPVMPLNGIVWMFQDYFEPNDVSILYTRRQPYKV